MNDNWLKNFLKLKSFIKWMLFMCYGRVSVEKAIVKSSSKIWKKQYQKTDKCKKSVCVCVCVCLCIYCCGDVNKAAKPQAAGINKRLLIINRLEYLIYCTEASDILYYCIFPFFIFMYFSIQDHYSPSVLLKEPLFYRKIYYLEHWNIFS